jgi:hypothetical protein
VEWLGVAEADMDNVNNRSLFRNRSGAAREKVRQMGRVREPQGILSAFPELMRVAAPQQPMMPQQMPNDACNL